jgi:hypothetical protein
MRPEEARSFTAHALAEAAAGRLRPVIGRRFPLERAADAHAAIEARATAGKTPLDVSVPPPARAEAEQRRTGDRVEPAPYPPAREHPAQPVEEGGQHQQVGQREQGVAEREDEQHRQSFAVAEELRARPGSGRLVVRPGR